MAESLTLQAKSKNTLKVTLVLTVAQSQMAESLTLQAKFKNKRKVTLIPTVAQSQMAESLTLRAELVMLRAMKVEMQKSLNMEIYLHGRI